MVSPGEQTADTDAEMKAPAFMDLPRNASDPTAFHGIRAPPDVIVLLQYHSAATFWKSGVWLCFR